MAQSIIKTLQQPVTLGAGLKLVWAAWCRHAVIALEAVMPAYFKERLLAIDIVANGRQLRVISDTPAGSTLAVSDPDDLPRSITDILDRQQVLPAVDRVTGALGLLPPSTVRKRIALPAAAKSNLQEAVGYQIDVETPFRGSDVYYGARVLSETPTTISVEVSVAPKTTIDQQISAIEQSGISIEKIYSCQSEDDPEPIVLLARRADAPVGMRRQILLMSLLTVALVALAMIAPLAAKAFEANRLGESAERSIQTAAPVIAAQRKLTAKLDAKATVAKVVQRFPDPLQVLAALTQSIPTDTWLTRFAMRDGEIQISGLTPSTSALIDELARSDMFYPPAYAAPAIRDSQFDRERFVLNMRLRPGL